MRLVLTDTDQACVRALNAAEPVPGEPLPRPGLLRILAGLIPCDTVSADLVDDDGLVHEDVSWPRSCSASIESAGGGILPRSGIRRLAAHPPYAEALRQLGLADCLAIGARHGPTKVAHLHLDRRQRPFTERDLSCLALVSPALQRLLRERPDSYLPLALTPQERHVLALVADGHANAEIAELLFVAPCTVRKHLEHAYRKLGVTNRMAAVAKLREHPLAAESEVDPRRPEFA